MPETSQTRLQLLQARIRLLGLDKLDVADRQVLEEYLAAADAPPAVAPQAPGEPGPAPDPDAQLAADIVRLVAAREKAATAQVEAARLKAEAAQAQAPSTPPMGLVAALQTPPFYFFFGLLLLGVAFVATQTNLNSSLTFLVAILGVAIVLYGTGSQAAGTFGSATEQAQAMLTQPAQAPQPAQPDQAPPAGDAGAQGAGAGQAQPAQDTPAQDKTAPRPSLFGSAGANVAIAGGAAVMAAFFGWGVIERSGEIRQVFRDFDQYVQVRVQFCDFSAAECRTDQETEQATADPVIDGQVRSAIINSAYIETPDGRRAHARPVGNGLEFVLFDRELGDKGEVRLMARATDGTGRVFSAPNDPFNPHSPTECLGRDPRNPQCALWTDRNGQDLERVPFLTLRAAILEQGNVQASSNSNVDLQVAPIEPN